MSLIELLVAVIIAASTIAFMSILFPKMLQSLSASRQRLEANNLAGDKLEQIQKAPYDVIGLTLPNASYFSNVTHVGCNCNQDLNNITSIPANATLVNGIPVNDTQDYNGVVYTRSVCINQEDLVGGFWQSMCAPPVAGWTETGMKDVHIRVSWTGASGPSTYDLETVISSS